MGLDIDAETKSRNLNLDGEDQPLSVKNFLTVETYFLQVLRLRLLIETRLRPPTLVISGHLISLNCRDPLTKLQVNICKCSETAKY